MGVSEDIPPLKKKSAYLYNTSTLKESKRLFFEAIHARLRSRPVIITVQTFYSPLILGSLQSKRFYFFHSAVFYPCIFMAFVVLSSMSALWYSAAFMYRDAPSLTLIWGIWVVAILSPHCHVPSGTCPHLSLFPSSIASSTALLPDSKLLSPFPQILHGLQHPASLAEPSTAFSTAWGASGPWSCVRFSASAHKQCLLL